MMTKSPPDISTWPYWVQCGGVGCKQQSPEVKLLGKELEIILWAPAAGWAVHQKWWILSAFIFDTKNIFGADVIKNSFFKTDSWLSNLGPAEWLPQRRGEKKKGYSAIKEMTQEYTINIPKQTYGMGLRRSWNLSWRRWGLWMCALTPGSTKLFEQKNKECPISYPCKFAQKM